MVQINKKNVIWVRVRLQPQAKMNNLVQQIPHDVSLCPILSIGKDRGFLPKFIQLTITRSCL